MSKTSDGRQMRNHLTQQERSEAVKAIQLLRRHFGSDRALTERLGMSHSWARGVIARRPSGEMRRPQYIKLMNLLDEITKPEMPTAPKSSPNTLPPSVGVHTLQGHLGEIHFHITAAQVACEAARAGVGDVPRFIRGPLEVSLDAICDSLREAASVSEQFEP